jgi:protein-S-isoprenylcysteine O-methyltransferase Ste14
MVPLTIGSRFLLVRKYPDLARERSQGRFARGVKAWDRIFSAVVGFYGNLAILITAGLDRRFDWSENLPGLFVLGGALVLLLGSLLSSWALLENRYFSSVVRIQEDRHHKVCETGPYRWIRHPGYSGSVLYYLAVPILLNRIWAIIPAFITVIFLILRTLLEDRVLQEELSGYKDYTHKVPSRLIPGLW